MTPAITEAGQARPEGVAGLDAALPGDPAAVFEVVPIAATGYLWTIVDNEIFLPSGGKTVQVEVFVGGWDPDMDGDPAVTVYQATLHCPDYYSALQGTLTPLDTPYITPGPEVPYPSFGIGADQTRDDYIFPRGTLGGCHLSHLCPDMVTPLAFYCGFVITFSVPDDGTMKYVTTFSFDVSADAKGTFTLGLSPDPYLTGLKDQNCQLITPLAVIPALITIDCRFDETVCEDSNACTTDSCDEDTGHCVNTLIYDPAEECCNTLTGAINGIDDLNPCTTEVCNPETGEVVYTPTPSCAATMGCRYLTVTGPPERSPVALLVTGDAEDPGVSCVSLYVQADGTLGVDPVFQTPEEWGAVYIHGLEIAPGSTYQIYYDDGETLSEPFELTTLIWGDTDGDGFVNIGDVLTSVQGFANPYINVPGWPFIDLEPCMPNEFINIGDVLYAVEAFTGSTYEDLYCSMPCP